MTSNQVIQTFLNVVRQLNSCFSLNDNVVMVGMKAVRLLEDEPFFSLELKYPPFDLVTPRPECRSDYECPTTKACVNEKCVDPCIQHSCGINAECRVRTHRPVCVCKAGFVGNPQTICEERKLS